MYGRLNDGISSDDNDNNDNNEMDDNGNAQGEIDEGATDNDSNSN